MGADRSPEQPGHKHFIDQVFEDQARELSPEEAAALGLPAVEDVAPQEPVGADQPDDGDERPWPAGARAEQEPLSEPPELGLPPVELSVDDRALVDEAMKKSGLIWVTTPTMPVGRAFWHAWATPTAYLLTGPGEQPDPDWPEGAPVSVLVRSKDNEHRLVTWDAVVTQVDPADADWDAATTALAAGRLNLRESGTAPARWAGGAATIYRLQPVGTLGDRPGAYPDASHRAAPVATPATTSARKPWVLHKRGGSGRALS